MKKLILGLTLMLIGLSAYGQIAKHALGIRAGAGFGYGNEISYQYGINEVNRIQLDLGARDNDGIAAFSLAGTYQWVEDLPEVGEKVRWYYGGGAAVGFLDRNSILITDGNYNTINLLGVLGIEYDFKESAKWPLLLAADVNPAFNLFNNNIGNLDLNLALSMRWQF